MELSGPCMGHFWGPRSPHCSARRARACGCSGSAACWKQARSLHSASRTSAGATWPVNLRTASSLWRRGAVGTGWHRAARGGGKGQSTGRQEGT